MIKEEDINLFKKYEIAPEQAFGGRVNPPSIVTVEEKEHYWIIYNDIINSCERALASSNFNEDFYIKSSKHSKERGVRGNRPKDLWCAVRNNNSDDFNEMPQIYVIASHRGVELGFAVSIAESDYSDFNIKLQNREIIPKLHKKLPIGGPIINKINTLQTSVNNWHFNKKTRLINGDKGFNNFANATEMFTDLKQENISNGGGAICKIYDLDHIKANPIDIEDEMRKAINIFGDLQKSCLPSASDALILSDAKKIIELSSTIDFDPSSIEDGREKKLRAVASRQGQKKFRNLLLQAYNSKCAFTNCDVTQVLQAAHIVPYNGIKTNDIKNGILLRADIHDLYDMFFISINPENYKITISSHLMDSYLQDLNMKQINLPNRLQEYPDKKVLEWHYNQFLINTN